jgi:hypothetical protein
VAKVETIVAMEQAAAQAAALVVIQMAQTLQHCKGVLAAVVAIQA